MESSHELIPMRQLQSQSVSHYAHDSETGSQVSSTNVSIHSWMPQYEADQASIHEGETSETESSSQLNQGKGLAKPTNVIPESSLRLKDWWMETLACGVILLSLLAISLAVGLHANKPLPQWPFGLSVNAVVAIFTTILRAAMFVVLSEGMLRKVSEEAFFLELTNY